VFTSHGPNVIMPTWFCSREWFYHVGKFDEGGKVSDTLIQIHTDLFCVSDLRSFGSSGFSEILDAEA